MGTLLGFLAAAALACVLAAVFPGRRAARIDIIRAVTTDDRPRGADGIGG